MLFLYLNVGEGKGYSVKKIVFQGYVEAIGNSSKKNVLDPLPFIFPLDQTISLFINFKMLIQICWSY